jgi:predicted HicB family RNase H-like nuclease
MTVELYIGNKKFDNSSERKSILKFTSLMKDKFGNSEELYVIIANYTIKGEHIGLTILTKKAILLVKIINTTVPFQVTENNVWKTQAGQLIGAEANPLQQVKIYREKWKDFLQENKNNIINFKNTDKVQPYWNTLGVVAIAPKEPTGIENLVSNDDCWWFRLSGMDKLIKVVEEHTCQWYDFTHQELRNIAQEYLELKSAKLIKNNSEKIKINLSIPSTLYGDIENIAKAEGKSLNKWIVDILAQCKTLK